MNSAGPAPDEDGATGEGLLRRWARRKQAAKAPPPAPAPASEAPQVPAASMEAAPMPELPDLDSLGASSDYGAFLQQGVPAELQRLALQRAWSSDAAISEFRGMAEYAWDFNAPQYGQLWAADDVARLIQAVVAPPPDAPPGPVLATGEAVPVVLDAAADPVPAMEPAVEHADDGMAQEGSAAPALPRRHGSALPC